jgi:hypothetical protein
MNQDAEHLRLLSLFHYIHAGLIAFYSMFALVYIFMGLMFAVIGLTIPIETHAALPPHVESKHEAHAESPIGPEHQDGPPAQQHSADGHSRDPFGNQEPPPAALIAGMGLMFACIGTVALLFGLAYSTASFLTGRSLARRTRRLFCLIVAGINCVNMPLGTILGVFTFVVLLRPSV